MLKGKRIFISGGSGVIGQELVPKLLNMGAVVLVGDLKPKPKHFSDQLFYIQGDLNYLSKEILSQFSPDLFIHLAATFERSNESYNFWEDNFWHNIRLSHHLATITKDLASVKKVINASSYLIYDPSLYSFNTPQSFAYSLKESDPIYPRNLTGMAKLAHEIELRFLQQFKSGEKSYINARIYRGYGKGSRCLISRWIRALLDGECIKVYRKEGLFDYIYAGDTADGLIQLALQDDFEGVVNLGTGKAQSVENVLSVLKVYFPEMQYTECDSDIHFEASQADTSLLKATTKWVPSTRLEDAIPSIIEFERNKQLEDKNIKCNVLLTSVSRKVPMANALNEAVKKLGQNSIIYGADIDKFCIGKYFTDAFWEMPRLIDLRVEQIIEYCKQNHINAIVPSRDQELSYFSEFKNALKSEGIAVMVSNKETVDLCVDKLKFYEVMFQAGFPVIPTSLIIDKNLSERWVVKERYGSGSDGLAINVQYEKALIFKQGLKNPIYQPYISGKEYSIDAFVTKTGKIKGVICRTRDLVVNGESQITTTHRHPAMEQLVIEVLRKFRFYGHVVFQIIENIKGDMHIIECNPRFGGASTLSISAGLDSFYWFLLESQGADIDEYPFIRCNLEKKQIRGTTDLVINK